MLRGVIAPNGYRSVFSIYYFNGKGTLKSVQTSTLVKNIFTMNLISANVELNINELMSYYGIRTFQDFADKIGVSKQLIGNWKRQNTYDVHKIMYAFPEVRREWLVFGEGDMLKSDAPKNGMDISNGIPMYDIDFACGFLEFNDTASTPDGYYSLAPYNDPKKYCAVRATGDSMLPTISDKDWVILGSTPLQIDDVIYGDVYGVETTTDMRTIKRIVRSDQPGCIRLVPDNQSPQYGSYQDISCDKVRRIYKVFASVNIKVL